MRQYKQILLANKAWATEIVEESADFFSRQLAGQKPEFLWIGCSDSRVGPEQMTMTPPGSMYIHRNIANLVVESDMNLMSVLQYAVDELQVPHIVVCGHYACDGIKAALAGGTDGPMDTWLQSARDVLHDHAEEIGAQPDQERKINRLAEVNVRDQLVRLARTKTVQAAFARGQELQLHGWVYDIRDGLIKPLMEIDGETTLDDIGQPDTVLV